MLNLLILQRNTYNIHCVKISDVTKSKGHDLHISLNVFVIGTDKTRELYQVGLECFIALEISINKGDQNMNAVFGINLTLFQLFLIWRSLRMILVKRPLLFQDVTVNRISLRILKSGLTKKAT
jgi:hypothetical protein